MQGIHLQGNVPASFFEHYLTIRAWLQPAEERPVKEGKFDLEVSPEEEKKIEERAVSDIWVTANFKENQLRKIRPGQRVTIKVDAYGTRLGGYVENIGAASGARFSLFPPENATGNYVKVVQRIPVRIRFAAGRHLHLLRPGMSVVPLAARRFSRRAFPLRNGAWQWRLSPSGSSEMAGRLEMGDLIFGVRTQALQRYFQ